MNHNNIKFFVTKGFITPHFHLLISQLSLHLQLPIRRPSVETNPETYHRSNLLHLHSLILSRKSFPLSPLLKDDIRHAKATGLTKTACLDYEILQVKSHILQNDLEKALSLIESLLPITAEYQKPRRCLNLHLLKAEVLTKTGRHTEAITLLQKLALRSELQGGSFRAQVLYLSSLARVGLLRHLKRKSDPNHKFTIIAGLPYDQFSILKIRLDVLLSARLFLRELRVREALRALHLLAKVDGESSKRAKNERCVLQVLRIQEFCARKVGGLYHCGNYEREFFKMMGRVWMMLQSVGDALV